VRHVILLVDCIGCRLTIATVVGCPPPGGAPGGPKIINIIAVDRPCAAAFVMAIAQYQSIDV